MGAPNFHKQKFKWQNINIELLVNSKYTMQTRADRLLVNRYSNLNTTEIVTMPTKNDVGSVRNVFYALIV